MTVDISYLRLLNLLFIIVPVILIGIYLKLHIAKRTAVAVLRMTIQLTAVGLILQLVFELDNTWLNIAYALMMMTVAAVNALRRTKLSFKRYGVAIFASFILSGASIAVFFNAFVVGLENIFAAQYMITITGMLLGNSLTGIIISINDFFSAARENKKAYYYTLAQGATRQEALMPYVQRALLSSVNPTLSSIETIGLVALPGMMTGQILGGSLPLTAIKYQIAIMVAILGVRFFGSLLAIYLCGRRAFDDFDIMIID